MTTTENKTQQFRVYNVFGENQLDINNYIDSLSETLTILGKGKELVEAGEQLQEAIKTANNTTLSLRERIKPLGDFLTKYVQDSFPDDDITAYFILHNEPDKKLHYHYIFQSNRRHDFDKKWLKSIPVNDQFINRLNPGKGTLNTIQAYLIHARNPEKQQFKPEDVYTAAGQPYEELYELNKDKWRDEYGYRYRRALVDRKNVEAIKNKIRLGEIKEEDFETDTDLNYVYMEYRPEIDDAFRARQKDALGKYKKRRAEGRIYNSAVFIEGAPDTGKTYLSDWYQELITALHENQLGEIITWYPASKSGDLFGEMKEPHEGISVDDCEAITPKTADIYKDLLDNQTGGKRALQSRYANKYTTHELVIISSTYDMWSYIVGSRQNVDQYVRRIDYVLRTKFKEGHEGEHPDGNNTEVEWYTPIKRSEKCTQIINYDHNDRRDEKILVPTVETYYDLQYMDTLSFKNTLRRLVSNRAVQCHMPVAENYYKTKDPSEIHALFDELYENRKRLSDARNERFTSTMSLEELIAL